MAAPPSDESLSPLGARPLQAAPLTDTATPIRARVKPGGGAADFVDALVQLQDFAPSRTTLAFERRALSSDPFLKALEQEVQTRGFGVRLFTTLAGENEVSHIAEVADDGQVTRTVAFGKAQMRRRFAPTANGYWNPTSSLFIRGVDASRVRLGENAEGAAVTRAAAADRLATGRRVSRNVVELGQSNYAGVFEEYANVEEVILVFANDSMVLGADNKQVIRRVVDEVDLQHDLFSILGCSFGKSAIENGNEVLATGRANRVKEELLMAGVPSDHVLDEGCWAGAPEENFPGRGVVLTVKRSRG